MMSGSFDLKDNLELAEYGLSASRRLNEREGVPDKPWVKRVATRDPAAAEKQRLIGSRVET